MSWIAVLLQFYISMTQADSRLDELIKYFSFMTIWTNILVALLYTSLILFPEGRTGKFFEKPVVQGGVLIYIIVVGLIYHFFLADVWNPQGLEKIADNLLHTIVPLFYLIYWIVFAEKGKLIINNVFLWLLYPLVYVIFALIRGAVSGIYPYPFINVSKLGYGITFRNIAFITIGYIVSGLILVIADKYMFKRNNNV